MAKRPRALYEADLQAQQTPFVAFGTPLPPLDPAVRDDGSYVPVWKQEVRDEKGRRRLHGAFTGGWSAGYYNTVGSKEGWTPSTFVSSRANRRKDNPDAAAHRPEDYMDEEDLADAEEARKIQTSHAFAGLGLTETDPAGGGDRGGGLAGLFKITGETMGTKLLKKMGWREGQGVGPKVRRAARLGVGRPGHSHATHLFAPEDVVLVRLVKKTDRKGLGFQGEAPLSRSHGGGGGESDEDGQSSDETGDEATGGVRSITSSLFGRLPSSAAGAAASSKKKSKKLRSNGIGIGVLNDTGSDDDDDPYDLGPRISFHRALGDDKKKKKDREKALQLRRQTTTDPDDTAAGVVKPALFSSAGRRAAKGNSAARSRLCHDGRPPLSGFVLAREPDPLVSDSSATTTKFPPPTIPPGWKSQKQAESSSGGGPDKGYASTADAARASHLDPKARAAVLGENQLPGKSVFDFLSAEARDRIAAATGRQDLPAARGEIPAEYALSEEEKREQLLRAIPRLEKATAVAAITRGARGGGPYQDNEAKRARYRGYLEHQAGIGAAPGSGAATSMPPRPAHWKDDDWLRELHEFYNCARIFRPMSGPMASRFTTSASAPASAAGSGTAVADNASHSGGDGASPALIARPAPKPQDPAEEAAKLGMYGPMTRSVQDFFPARLLCKRLGVPPPAGGLQPDEGGGAGRSGGRTSAAAAGSSSSLAWWAPGNRKPDVSAGKSAAPMETGTPPGAFRHGEGAQQVPSMTANTAVSSTAIQTDRNEALEGPRAGEDVFRAVFGDSDEDDRTAPSNARKPASSSTLTNLLSSSPPLSSSRKHQPRRFALAASACPPASAVLPDSPDRRAAPALPRYATVVESTTSRCRTVAPPGSDRLAGPDEEAAVDAPNDEHCGRLVQEEKQQQQQQQQQQQPQEPKQKQKQREEYPDADPLHNTTTTTTNRPPQYPLGEPSTPLTPFSPTPRPLPAFSSLQDASACCTAAPTYADAATLAAVASYPRSGTAASSASGSALAPPPSFSLSLLSSPASSSSSSSSYLPPASSLQDETKRALPPDVKRKGDANSEDETEPPPAYSEGSSPLPTFSFLMAAAGGASSILTQVQQGGPPTTNLSSDASLDETIAMDLRGTRFVLSREELLTLPEFVLLSLFPNGLFPEGQMAGGENDAIQVDYDPASLQYMLDFFRGVAQSIPADPSAGASTDGPDVGSIDPMAAATAAGKDDASRRAGIIVLREDLDFYAIPPRAGMQKADMMEVKRAAAAALLRQDGIFSGLKRSDEPGTTEAHLIEMLTAGGFDHDDTWGHRAGEPHKAVVCSLALARLRSDIRGSEMSSSAVGMAQKLLLFWRKPARRCWWEGVHLDNVEGVDGPLKVWIRRVWTLEMSVIGLR